MNFTTGEEELLLSGLTHSVAIDFDYQEQMLYWTDIQSQNSYIYRVPLKNTTQREVGVRITTLLKVFRIFPEIKISGMTFHRMSFCGKSSPKS